MGSQRISNNVELIVELNQDTALINDEISLKIIFRNKADSCFHFHPDAFLCIDRYIPADAFIAGEDWSAYYLSKYSNINNLVLLKPQESYSKTYKMSLRKPLLILGNNKLIVKYMCSENIRNREQKIEYEILYGGMQSTVFEIFIKDK